MDLLNSNFLIVSPFTGVYLNFRVALPFALDFAEMTFGIPGVDAIKDKGVGVFDTDSPTLALMLLIS
jgi:hypothetical protein